MNDDVNLALQWSGIPLLHGQHPQLTDFNYIEELDLYTPVDKYVDLTREYSIYSEVEFNSPMKVNSYFLNSEIEDKRKIEVYKKYFERISKFLLSTSNRLVEVIYWFHVLILYSIFFLNF